jgi:UDP-N-acetylmuramoyl-L-alanyl-D-glutamate--2,6-diaminopimelate ligase
MTLVELLGGACLPAGAKGLPTAGLAFDSRAVKPGDLFFAVAGTHADGLAYAERAIKSGAVAIVAEREPDAPLGVPTIVVADARAALAAAAARFYPGAP